MSRLLDDSLNLSRANLATESAQQVPLNDIVEEAGGLVAREVEECRVEIHYAADLPMVFVAPRQLVEVFQNLISNAVRFMGGQEEPLIEIGARVDSGWVNCYVRDNGIGIEPQYHDRIFNLFERLDSDTQGTGIGLAVVKRIIERHGVSIRVAPPEADSGCFFEFTLPAVESAPIAVG